jgi:type I restriction enzyme M protein
MQANEEKGPKLLVPTENLFINKNIVEQVALQIRQIFDSYIEEFNSWFKELWKDRQLHLSNSVLVILYQLFDSIEFRKIPFDIRSAALKEFIPPEVRRGLGIYLTPDDVVKMMVNFVEPSVEKSVYDLACGSGTFLIETLKFRKPDICLKEIENVVWGTDKNPRMLLIAELNMGNFSSVIFKRRVM